MRDPNMIWRWFFINIIFAYTFMYGANILEKVSLNDEVLELQFKSPLTSEQIYNFNMNNPNRQIFGF